MGEGERERDFFKNIYVSCVYSGEHKSQLQTRVHTSHVMPCQIGIGMGIFMLTSDDYVIKLRKKCLNRFPNPKREKGWQLERIPDYISDSHMV